MTKRLDRGYNWWLMAESKKKFGYEEFWGAAADNGDSAHVFQL